jgi:hypothetical protein
MVKKNMFFLIKVRSRAVKHNLCLTALLLTLISTNTTRMPQLKTVDILTEEGFLIIILLRMEPLFNNYFNLY